MVEIREAVSKSIEQHQSEQGGGSLSDTKQSRFGSIEEHNLSKIFENGYHFILQLLCIYNLFHPILDKRSKSLCLWR